jgi:hypothetical protein
VREAAAGKQEQGTQERERCGWEKESGGAVQRKRREAPAGGARARVREGREGAVGWALMGRFGR